MELRLRGLLGCFEIVLPVFQEIVQLVLEGVTITTLPEMAVGRLMLAVSFQSDNLVVSDASIGLLFGLSHSR